MTTPFATSSALQQLFSTNNAPQDEVKEVVRLDNWQAFIFLFAVSFGPAFIVVDLTTDSSSVLSVNIVLLVLIFLTFVSNAISIWMLTRVQSYTKLGSYQEVAYSVSKGNRGYIFLISIMKIIYLVVTCAYCLQFIANYLTVLVLIRSNTYHTDWAIWGIYCSWLIVLSATCYSIYIRQKSHESMIFQARILMYLAAISVVLMILFLLPCFSDGWKRVLYKQLCHNGNSFNTTSNSFLNYTKWQGDDLCCVNNQIQQNRCPPAAVNFVPAATQTSTQIFAKSMSYAPTIAYCNMFSIFYLEIISITKLVTGKTKSDSHLGMAVNIVISGFYFLLFLMISLFQYGADKMHKDDSQPKQTAIEIFFLKNWYAMQNPYNMAGRKTSLTIFDINMVILVVILFIHCLMNLFIAKESALIYADEVYNKSLSQMLDLKRQGGNGTSYLQETSNARTGEPTETREGNETQIYRMAYMKLEKARSQPIINLVFILVFLFALINTSEGSLLIGLWGVVGSIVCPLIVTVLPGSFFYYVLKDQEVEGKGLKAAGICYSLFGLVLLPIYLTLSTKNLFSNTAE